MLRRLLLACALVAAFVAPAFSQEDWTVKDSPHSVGDTVTALTGAIEKAGAKVFAVVDHQAGATAAGLDLPPTTTVIFGNPKIGTPLMQANRRIALDLPVKVLVWEEDGQTRLGYLQPQSLAGRYAIGSDAKPVQMMTGALAKLTDAAIAE